MESFVKGHEKSHFLQTPAWAQVKEAWEWRGIVAYEENRIIGAMSVLIRPPALWVFDYVRSPGTGLCSV